MTLPVLGGRILSALVPVLVVVLLVAVLVVVLLVAVLVVILLVAILVLVLILVLIIHGFPPKCSFLRHGRYSIVTRFSIFILGFENETGD